MICADGGRGLIAALPIVHPDIPLQRCRAHKIRNLLDKVRKSALQAIMNVPNRPRALRTGSRIAGKPDTPSGLRKDLDDLLTCLRSARVA